MIYQQVGEEKISPVARGNIGFASYNSERDIDRLIGATRC